MAHVEELSTLIKDFRASGLGMREAVAEWERQLCVNHRELEQRLIDSVPLIDPNDDSLRARHLREVVLQIMDHREAGNYTTNCPHPRGYVHV